MAPRVFHCPHCEDYMFLSCGTLICIAKYSTSAQTSLTNFVSLGCSVRRNFPMDFSYMSKFFWFIEQWSTYLFGVCDCLGRELDNCGCEANKYIVMWTTRGNYKRRRLEWMDIVFIIICSVPKCPTYPILLSGFYIARRDFCRGIKLTMGSWRWSLFVRFWNFLLPYRLFIPRANWQNDS